MTITDLSLLDLLYMQMGCTYLSDLRDLNAPQRKDLVRRVDRIPAKEEDLKDWNDALAYLTQSSPEQTAQAAKERLINLLSK